MKKTFTLVIAAWSILSLNLFGQDVEGFFKQNCASCHSIGGGRLTGPDLKNVHLRKDESWIKNFISDPQTIINSGDVYARELLSDSRGVIMPKVGGLTPFIIQSLFDFIKEESAKEKSKYGGSAITDRPLTPSDIVKGRALFIGETRLKNNGPTCIGCHSVAGEGLLGGGLLGPDLTNVYGRLGGKKPLAAWLASPASETMGPIYQKHPIDEEEVLPLVAFFKDKAVSNVSVAGVHDFNFIIFGFVGLAIVLVLFDLFWGNRLRSIRRNMVEGKI
ncbi:MAG: c-type cytochrome [Candidatus Marinimicrobia bacterium]|nr:c-type cytochrome [Candidatus Neomarinimicrobiota bacterium]